MSFYFFINVCIKVREKERAMFEAVWTAVECVGDFQITKCKLCCLWNLMILSLAFLEWGVLSCAVLPLSRQHCIKVQSLLCTALHCPQETITGTKSSLACNSISPMEIILGKRVVIEHYCCPFLEQALKMSRDFLRIVCEGLRSASSWSSCIFDDLLSPPYATRSLHLHD